MSFVAFALSSMTFAQEPVAAQSAEPPDPAIVVTGTRPERSPNGRPEEPYPETERVVLGSRIARRVERRPFRSVATETGLAGMIGNSGAGSWDGTGSSNHAVRSRLATECVAEHAQVSEAVACILFRVKRHIEAGDYDSAREALAPLLERRHLTSWERYYVGHYAYRLAVAMEDDAGRAQALQMMLESGRLPEEQRGRAHRVLASLQSGAQ
jgi:hypothetical protein